MIKRTIKRIVEGASHSSKEERIEAILNFAKYNLVPEDTISESDIEGKSDKDVIDYLNPGDCLVINDTKVIPARLIGEKVGTGAAIEVLLLTRKQDLKDTWEVLVKPGKKQKSVHRSALAVEN